MALVDYSDSENSEDDLLNIENKAGKNTTEVRYNDHLSKLNSTLPPLPDSFHNLYTSDSRKGNQDDPSLHAGRQRLIPHVEGNWPSHVYIEWYPSKEESTRIDGVIDKIQYSEQSQVHSLLRSDLGTALPLHISLSRPLTLVTHERQNFNDTLALEINRSNIRPFEVSVHGLDWVSNNEKTRWFLVMRVSKPPMNELNRILKVSNVVVQKFRNLPLYTEPQPPGGLSPSRKLSHNNHGKNYRASPYYSSHSRESHSDVMLDVSSHFHISIGWRLTQPPEESKKWVNSRVNGDFNFNFIVKSIRVKIGNAVTALVLPIKLDFSNGIIDA